MPDDLFSRRFRSGKKKQHKHKLFGPGFPADIPDPYARTPRGQKVSPHQRGRRKPHFWCGRPRFSARTSMTRRVVEKLCTKKVCVDFLAPIREGISFPNFVERYILKLPSKLCAEPVLYRTEQSFEGENGRKGAEKRGGRGWPAKWAKRKKGRVKTDQQRLSSPE